MTRPRELLWGKAWGRMQRAGHRPTLQGARGGAGVPERLWGNAADASVGLTRGLGGTASCLPRTLVEVQCLGHHASTAGGTGSIPGQGIKTRPAVPGVQAARGGGCAPLAGWVLYQGAWLGGEGL